MDTEQGIISCMKQICFFQGSLEPTTHCFMLPDPVFTTQKNEQPLSPTPVKRSCQQTRSHALRLVPQGYWWNEFPHQCPSTLWCKINPLSFTLLSVRCLVRTVRKVTTPPWERSQGTVSVLCRKHSPWQWACWGACPHCLCTLPATSCEMKKTRKSRALVSPLSSTKAFLLDVLTQAHTVQPWLS